MSKGSDNTAPNPSRRFMLAGSATALLTGAAIATMARGANGDDADLWATCRDLLATGEKIHAWNADAFDLTDDESDALLDHWWATIERLIAAPAAQTPAGRAAKIRAAHAVMRFVLIDHEDLRREEVFAIAVLAELEGSATT